MLLPVAGRMALCYETANPLLVFVSEGPLPRAMSNASAA
jgi:hypothetical protein